MADTQAAIVEITRDLIAEQTIPVGWDGKGQLADNEPAVLAASKAAMLPCIPTIDINNPTANPSNVQTLQSVVPLELWSQVVLPNKVGAGEGNAPRPEGFANPADSYRAFLTVAARFPYFCGEEGVWDSVKEACQREFSTIFAHAIQETGEKPVPADEQVWQTSLFYTREITCYPNNCPSYNAGAEAFDPPSDVGYYGRGMKQLSYAYNYAAFSATYFGDMRVLIDNPDLVATDPHLLLGSGVWFAMSPQPPKPSMHDVMTGIYQPADLPAQGFEGVTTQGNGSVFNKFDTTVSIINGAVECSPLDGSGKPEEKELNVQRSKNRFINFKALLPVVGVPESEQTKYERDHSWTDVLSNCQWQPFRRPVRWYIPIGLEDSVLHRCWQPPRSSPGVRHLYCGRIRTGCAVTGVRPGRVPALP